MQRTAPQQRTTPPQTSNPALGLLWFLLGKERAPCSSPTPSNEVFSNGFKILLPRYNSFHNISRAKSLFINFHGVGLYVHVLWSMGARKMEEYEGRMTQDKIILRCLTTVNTYWVPPACCTLGWTFHISHMSLMFAAWRPKFSVPTLIFISQLLYFVSSLSGNSCVSLGALLCHSLRLLGTRRRSHLFWLLFFDRFIEI